MVRKADKTHRAASKSTSVAAARAAVQESGSGDEREPSIDGMTPLVNELRKAGLLPMLVLRFVADGPSYGNQLIERISELTSGTLEVNPNTMYPLLRSLEAKGQIVGEWEHPERRSRRFYRITDAGRRAVEDLANELLPRLDQVASTVQAIRAELLDSIRR